MSGYDFECECCGEEYDASLKFKGYIITSKDEREEYNEGVCPDCLGTWFMEDPESIKKFHFIKEE